MKRIDSRWLACGLLCLALLIGSTASAQAVKESLSAWDDLQFRVDGLLAQTVVQPIDAVEVLDPALLAAWGDFASMNPGWRGTVDLRSGRLEFAEGPGLPWVPGYGNTLELDDIAAHMAGRSEVTLEVLESIARQFLGRHAGLFAVDPAQLVLNPGRSGKFADYLWFVDFDLYLAGMPVDGARLVMRVNNGNLIHFGAEKLAPRWVEAPPVVMEREMAFQLVDAYVGGLDELDEIVDPGSTHLIPVEAPGTEGTDNIIQGQGYGLRAVWQFVFRRPSVMGTWRARVDATSGELVEFGDIAAYAGITGGVYPITFYYNDETIMAMPFADTGQAPPDDIANSSGLYNWTGGSNSSILNSDYVRITDVCGSISMAADGNGDILFGSSSGTDCTTPGNGGAGNTHAARTQFYHVNWVKEKARAWLPSNTWLQGQLEVRVNVNSTCNANYDYTRLNFFRSGGGCGNTGEVAAISLHEFAHALDDHDGNGFSPDGGTGETYGDFTGAIQVHDSCMGDGFYLSGGNCSGYGDACTSCSGVRDIDWGLHASNTPHTPANFTSPRCGSGGCVGPCNRECHCESYPPSEALYDLAAKDLVAGSQTSNPSYPDMNGPYAPSAAWAVMDRLWFVSRPTAGAVYVCNGFNSHGCATNTYFRVFRAVDDDNGNTTDGTPHSCYIAAAFARHDMECTTDTGYNTCYSACTPPAIPTLSVLPANEQVQLNWTSSGGGAVYDVFRNDLGCGTGFTKIAEDVAVTSYLDTGLANGTTYYYQVTAQPTGNEACSSQPSVCQSATPIPCNPPTAPSWSNAAPNGDNRIDVSWGAAAGVTEYHVYRSMTTGGPYSQIAIVTAPTTSYADTDVSGGTTYYYVVRSFLDCESANSPESSATATGVCTLPPTFAGIQSVVNPQTATCVLQLSWDPAVSHCGGVITYNIYRDTTAGFTPGPANLLAASPVSGTIHTDQDNLITGTRYYYVVRAQDSESSEEGNTVELSGVPTGSTEVRFLDEFETGNLGWVFSLGSPAAATGDFLIGDPVGTTGNYGDPSQPEDDHTAVGVNCLYSAENPGGSVGTDDIDNGEVIATSPTFDGSGLASVELDMWRWFFNEDTDDSGDYYYLEVSNDDGASWTVLENIPDTDTSTNSWSNAVFSLEQYVALSATMKVRIRAADGTAAGDLVEAAIDDIVITGYTDCTTSGCPGFSCGAITIDADPVCSGTAQQFTASYSGGEGAVSVAWDFDADGQYDDCFTNPCTTTLPLGVNTVGVRATDSCSFGVQTCTGSTTATVEGPLGAPQAPVGFDPFPCVQSPVRISWEAVAGAITYDLRVDGTTVITDVTSPYFYDPGNMLPHGYAVRATNTCGNGAWSPVTTFADSSPLADILFCDGVESGDMSAWDVAVPTP